MPRGSWDTAWEGVTSGSWGQSCRHGSGAGEGGTPHALTGPYGVISPFHGPGGGNGESGGLAQAPPPPPEGVARPHPPSLPPTPAPESPAAAPLCVCFAVSCLHASSWMQALGCKLCDSRDCSGHRCVPSAWVTASRLVGPPWTFADVQMRTDGRRTAQGRVGLAAARGRLRARPLGACPYAPRLGESESERRWAARCRSVISPFLLSHSQSPRQLSIKRPPHARP